MKRISKRNRTVLRSMTVTLVILACSVAATYLMGMAYSAIQRDAYGVEMTAFSVDSKDYVTLFGNEVYFPLINVVQTAKDLFTKYCSGLIKLLGYAIDIAKESASYLFNCLKTFIS